MPNPNLRRFDLSNTLIHFTRGVNMEDDDAPPELAGSWGWGEMTEGEPLSPFFLLRSIVRRRQIRSTYSIRKGKPTIYGPHPAVCFTEMPVAAFIQSASERQDRGENMSPYAVILPKEQAFRRGARQVIYGSSGRVESVFKGEVRRLAPAIYADRELYRYVAYDPTRSGVWTIDWTHEREWRWPNRKWVEPAPMLTDAFFAEERRRADDRIETDGLNLDKPPFAGLGLVVKSELQARRLTSDILHLVDRGTIGHTLFSHILHVPDLRHIQGLHDPAVLEGVMADNVLDLDPYFVVSDGRLLEAERQLAEIDDALRHADVSDAGEGAGISAVWLLDPMALASRALVRLGRVHITATRRYLLRLPAIEEAMDVRAKEELSKLASDLVAKRLHVPATYFTVVGDGKSWDDVPFYAGSGDMDDLWMSLGHDKNDY